MNTKATLLAAALLALATITPAHAEERGHAGGIPVEVACKDAGEFPIHAYEVYTAQVKSDRKRLKYSVAEDNSVLYAWQKGCKKGKAARKAFVNNNCWKVFHVISDTRGSVTFQLVKTATNRCAQ